MDRLVNIFLNNNISEYIRKVFYYGSQVWSCQYSGLTGMTYKEAMQSEEEALKKLKDLPECLKEPLLKTIHQGEGRLNDILVNCSKKIKTEYFLDEEVIFTNSKNGKKQFGVIVDVIKSNGEGLHREDPVTPDKENGLVSTQKEKIGYKYNINLTGCNVILTDISPDNIRRKTKTPNKELLKLFLKSSADKCDIKGKPAWLAKDELIKKYHLPAVSKANPELSQHKDPLRSPLCIISGPNDGIIQKKNAKHSSKKSPKNNNPTQRTLNCFIKEVKKDTRKATPTKDDLKKALVNPLIPEINVYLTPTKKQKTMLEDYVDKGDNPVKQTKKIVEKHNGAAFDKKPQDDGKKDEKEAGKNVICITVNEPEILVVGEQGSRDFNEEISPMENEDDNVKKIGQPSDNHEIFLIDDKSNDKVKDEKTQENDLTIDKVNQELCKKDKKIVKKNTMKKQKTISEMLNLSITKQPKTNKDDQEKKLISVREDNILTQPILHSCMLSMEDKQRICEENERKIRELKELEKEKKVQAKLKAAMRYEESELVLKPLPLPKPVSVPDELKQCYGEILMITDFIFAHANFVSQEEEIKLAPDGLITCLMSRTAGFDIVQRILIAFLKILLKDLQKNEYKNTAQLLELDVDLFYVPLTKEVIGEVTRLYLEQDQKEHLVLSSHKNKKKKIAIKQPLHLSRNILATLKEKEFVELSPLEKVEVLAYLLQRVLESDIFYNHVEDVNEKKKHTLGECRILVKEKNDLTQDLKYKLDARNGQNKINLFLVKDEVNEKCEKTDEVGDESRSKDDELICVEARKETTNTDENNKEICNLTNKQELLNKVKIEKEKDDEIRNLNEELYQKDLKVTRLKKAVKNMIHSLRNVPFGSDRDHTRYWLFPSYPVGLFVEKTTKYPVEGDGKQEEDKEENILKKKEQCCWFHYDNIEDIKMLINSLNNQGVRESLLKKKLKKEFTEMEKDYMKRPVDEGTKSGGEEEKKEEDPLTSLKEELTDLANRVSNGFMGDVSDLTSLVKTVDHCCSANDLVSCVIELGSSVRIKNFSKNLKDPEKWLKEKWIPAVQQAETTSRLHFCLILLDCCIKWEECTLYLKCKICRKNGGNMVSCKECHKGYHTTCLRSPCDEESLEQWLCPCCKPSVSKRRAVIEENEIVDESEEEEEEEEEEQHVNEDYCDVCGGHGDLICCDYCPKVYHKECHEPPIKNTPRGIWNCSKCQDNEGEECYLNEDSSDSSDTSCKEKQVSIKRTRHDVESAKENEIPKKKRFDNKISNFTRKRKNSPSGIDENVGGKRKSRQDPKLTKCEDLLRELVKHKDSWPFLEPVDLREVPDYLEVVSCTIDFGTIKKQLDGLEYTTYKDCLSDIQLVFSNSNNYNVDTSDHGLAGISLESYFNEILPSYFPEYQDIIQPARSRPRRVRSNRFF